MRQRSDRAKSPGPKKSLGGHTSAATRSLNEKWRELGHDVGFRHCAGYATLGTIGFEGRFDYAAIGTVSNVASRLCDEAKPGQILISPRVLMEVEDAVTVEPVGEFELKGIRRPVAAYNVVAALRQVRDNCKYGRGSKVSGQFTSERRSDIFATYAVTTIARTRRNAANCGVARKTRHVRVRPALC